MSGESEKKMSSGLLIVAKSQEIEPPTAERSAAPKEEGASKYEVRLSDGARCWSAPPGLPSPEAKDRVLGRAFPSVPTVTAVHPSVLESNVLTARTAAETGLVTRPLASREPMRISASPTPPRTCMTHLCPLNCLSTVWNDSGKPCANPATLGRCAFLREFWRGGRQSYQGLVNVCE